MIGHEAFVIALHIPGLFAGDLHGFQRIGDPGTRSDLFEARDRFFVSRVDDRGLAVSAVLRQFLGGERPLAVCTGLHGQGINGRGAVLDVNRDLLRQQFGAVTLQVPDLLAADRCQFRNVGVMDVVAGDYLTEAGRHFFIHRVSDFGHAVCFVLRQFSGGEGPLVVLAGGYGQRINNVVALLDVDSNACGHESCVITLHIPCLLTADIRCLQSILHCICEASVSGLGDFGRVVRNCVFSYRVINALTAGLLRQVVPLISPVIFFIQFYGRCLCTVSPQVDSHTGGTIAIPVVAVFPNLGHFDLRLFGCMGICDGVREGSVCSLCNLRRVVGYSVFRNRIVNSCTVGILVQIGPGMCPAVACIQLNGTNLCTVSQQVDRNAGRTIAILVVGVIPGLRNRNLGLLRCMAVGQGSNRAIPGSVRQ